MGIRTADLDEAEDHLRGDGHARLVIHPGSRGQSQGLGHQRDAILAETLPTDLPDPTGQRNALMVLHRPRRLQKKGDAATEPARRSRVAERPEKKPHPREESHGGAVLAIREMPLASSRQQRRVYPVPARGEDPDDEKSAENLQSVPNLSMHLVLIRCRRSIGLRMRADPGAISVATVGAGTDRPARRARRPRRRGPQGSARPRPCPSW